MLVYNGIIIMRVPGVRNAYIKGGPQNRGLFDRKLELGNFGNSNVIGCEKYVELCEL